MRICHFCGKKESRAPKEAFIECDKCGHFFCKEHIYAGSGTYTNICENCVSSVAPSIADTASLSSAPTPNFPIADHSQTPTLQKNTGWEYKMEYLPIPSEVDYDYALFDKKSNTMMEPYQFDLADAAIPNIDRLNELGSDGWEIISVIPKTKGLIMRGEDYRDFSMGGGNIVGVYILFKRPVSK